MFLAVRLAVLLVLVTSLESGVPRSKRNAVPESHVTELNLRPVANAVTPPNRNLEEKAPAKTQARKTSTRTPQLNEFPLEAILFKGRETNEANAFIKSNIDKGKTLEQHYEQAREQDMNEIEQHLMKVYQDYKQSMIL